MARGPIAAARGAFIWCAALSACLVASETAMQTSALAQPRAGASADPVLSATALFPVPLAGTATTGMTGEIRGTVVDQTAPAHPVAGQPVHLEIVEPASNATRATTTDPQGRYAFPGLPLGGVRVFLVEVEYGGVPYIVRAVLTSDAPVHDVRLTVFASTNDQAAVRGTVAFAVLELGRNAVRVNVIQRLSNATDRAIAVTDRNPLVFPMPLVSPAPHAVEPIEFVGGWRNPRVANGAITDAIPLLPGSTEVAYAFAVEPRARRATLRWGFPYGAADVELLADPTIKVSGAALHAHGIIVERSRRYARWSAGPVPRSEAVFIILDGLPISAPGWPEIVAGVFAVALASGLAAALRRRPATT